MITLTEEQFQLIHQYLELVRTVSEAFTYVVTSFDNLAFTEGDVILGEIFTALQQFSGTHAQLAVLFYDHVSVKDLLSQFSDIVQQVNELDPVWTNVETRQQLIREKLAPTYTTWSNNVLNALQPLTIS